MSSDFLRKIIMEEVRNVLNEQASLRSREVMKLQKLLKTAGYNVGVIDGVAGPKLYAALSQANKDISGVSVQPSQVQKDFESDPDMAASNFLSVLGSPEQIATAKNRSVSSRPVKPESAPSVAREMGRMPTRDLKPKVGDRMKGELGTEVWNGREWVPEGEYVPR